MHIDFEVIEKAEGGFVAGCYDRYLFAEEETLEDLYVAIEKLVNDHWVTKKEPKPSLNNIRLVVHRN